MRGISLCQPPALKKAVLAEESPRFCFATALPTAFGGSRRFRENGGRWADGVDLRWFIANGLHPARKQLAFRGHNGRLQRNVGWRFRWRCCCRRTRADVQLCDDVRCVNV